MSVRVETTGYGASALATLQSVAASYKVPDAMAPVTVIAPNNIAGIVARRHLAAGTPEHPGIAGIEITTLTRLAERIAAPLLAPRRPATRPVVAAAWRHALTDIPGRFRGIADHPATVRALVAAHAELRDLSPSGLDAVKSSGNIGHDLVVLHKNVVQRLGPSWFDAIDVLAAASGQAAKAFSGAAVLYLPQDLSQAEAALVDALAQRGDLTVIAGFTGAKRADEAIERTMARLNLAPSDRPDPRTASRVMNASDSDDEVRCVVRDVVTRLQTTPAHRIAVLYSAPAPYARLLHEHMTAADLTVNGAGMRLADERAVSRVLMEVLDLASSGMPRAALFQALANAPVRDFTGERIPVPRWERTSRSAGVVSGEGWRTRLDAYIADREAQARDEQEEPDPKPWLVERFQRDVLTATSLQAFATQLRDELIRASAMTTWREISTWCLNLFTTLIGSTDELTHLPPEEQYAATAIIFLLRSLDGLDGVASTASLPTLRDVLDSELTATLPRVGRFGDGVFVGSISSAIGLDLDVIYLVGLSEDLFPGRIRADALLPDRVREATGGELPAQRERLHAKYRQLLAAFASADDVVVSFARGDLRRSSQRLPSRFLLPTLRELSGVEDLAATAWQQPDNYGTTVSTSGSFAGELLSTDELSTEQEWRTRQVPSVGVLADDAVVTAAIAMIQARGGDDLTRFDGNLSAVAGLPDYAAGELLVSPTMLESYAECPHGFFVERLLGVRPVEQPEDIVHIDPREIGNLIHGSVDELVNEFASDLPGEGQPWTVAQRARLVDVAVAKAEGFKRRGLTGHPRLWDRERERIMNDVQWLLHDDDQWRAAVNARVVTSEMPFGLRGAPPVEVAIPGGRVLMRGSADKVDIGADGTIFVTDLKTGSSRTFKAITQDDPLVGGTKLQLPIYAYAARERFGDSSTPVSANYWFVRRDRGRKTIQLTPEVEQAYARTLAVIVNSIAGGLFPPKAPDKPDFAWTQCVYCNPDDIGHADNRERWERKRHDPLLRDLVNLVEPDALSDAGSGDDA